MTVQTPPSPQPYSPVDPKNMTVVEHLEELRRRLIISIIGVAAGSVVGWFLAPRVLRILVHPVEQIFHQKLYVDTVYGAFTLQLKVAIILGFMIALPITVYQVWAFVAPAFGPGANRWAPIWMFSALALFAGGAVTGYFVFPLALHFFGGFQGSLPVQVLPFANQYIGFITLILVVFGLSFELPLVLVSLSAVGVTSSGWLASKRIYAFFAIFAFAMIVTPGADWISPLILGAILYVLFEASIIVSRLLGK
ncbi:MAG TPA: twin-arginine translocase subunit TatC [Chloroflexota bacterium]|nr:twin-arginine translocase subunit TatC [Chloroflexota bacterium]